MGGRSVTRRRKERAVGNSMSCTDEEWARIRAVASAAGEGIGRHVVRRCLTDDPSPNARPQASQALSPKEQREMHDAVLGISRVRPDPELPEHPEMWLLRCSVQALCQMRFEAMEREGRTEDLHAMLREAFGEEEGRFVAWSIRTSLEGSAKAG